VFAIDLSQTVPYYYFALFVVGGVGLLLYLLVRSDYGEILHAIRQNELRMRYLGYDTDREKLIAWVLSAVTSSLAGAVYVGTIGLAAPQMMSFALTGEVLIWVVVGGSGTLVGPFVAAVALTLLEESLVNLWAEGYLIVLGLLFVGFIFFLPNGLAGLVQRMRE
jgi:ABC-type branched-subunit amino acid transport system permease subunit